MILEAIRERAWLPEQIEGVSSKYTLEGSPPQLQDVPEWIDRGIERKVMAAKPTGPTALATAYQKAKNRAA